MHTHQILSSDDTLVFQNYVFVTELHSTNGANHNKKSSPTVSHSVKLYDVWQPISSVRECVGPALHHIKSFDKTYLLSLYFSE